MVAAGSVELLSGCALPAGMRGCGGGAAAAVTSRLDAGSNLPNTRVSAACSIIHSRIKLRQKYLGRDGEGNDDVDETADVADRAESLRPHNHGTISKVGTRERRAG